MEQLVFKMNLSTRLFCVALNVLPTGVKPRGAILTEPKKEEKNVPVCFL